MPTIPITLNEAAQDPLETRSQIVNDLQNAGLAVTASDILLDADGKLVLNMKTAAAVPQEQQDQITANNGAASFVVLPDSPFAFDFTNMTFADRALESGENISARWGYQGDPGGTAGQIIHTGYVDGFTNDLGQTGFTVSFQVQSYNTTGLTINDGDIVLHYDGASLALKVATPFTIVGDGSNGAAASFHVDAAGNLYESWTGGKYALDKYGTSEGPRRTWRESVIYGAQ